MDLAFLDPCRWDYDVETPWERPLGGSQSALCYLAAELAASGHAVRLFSRTSRPGVLRGVDCVGYEGLLAPEGLWREGLDAAIVLNGPAEAGPELAGALAGRAPLYLWTQHAHDQPAVAGLAQAVNRDAWDGVVCVSDWQRGEMVRHFGLDPERVFVRRNGVGPRFQGLFASREELIDAKAGPLSIAYTSTPFRGLDVLLHAFAEARRRFPEATLEVYSSMAVYQVPAQDDPCAQLYADCRENPGIHYHGSIPQPELASGLRRTTLLGYPNTFPETSCIAVMEALAAGLYVVTSDLGALPETCMGCATLVEGPREEPDGLLDFARRYGRALIDTLERHAADPEAFARKRVEQVALVGERCSWQRRAQQWVEALPSWWAL